MPDRDALFSARRPGVFFVALLGGLSAVGVGVGLLSYLLSGGPL